MIKKIDTFIYSNFNKLKSKFKKKLNHYHNIIVQIKESDLDKKYDRNPYEIFRDWSIEVLQYGILLSITLIILNISFTKMLVFIIPLGILRWIIFDTIKEYKKIK